MGQTRTKTRCKLGRTNKNFRSLVTCSTVLPEKLIGSQPVKTFPTFYGTRRFITAFTSARHLSLSSRQLDPVLQSIPPIIYPYIRDIIKVTLCVWNKGGGLLWVKVEIGLPTPGTWGFGNYMKSACNVTSQLTGILCAYWHTCNEFKKCFHDRIRGGEI